MSNQDNQTSGSWADDYFALGEVAFALGLEDVGQLGYEQAQELGHPKASDRLIDLHKVFESGPSDYAGKSTTIEQEDPGEMHERLIAQMDSGDLNAANELGNLMAEVDMYEEAIMFHEKAALAGHVDAQSNLGADYYWLGDLENAIKWYTLAAESGYAIAQNNLATLYMRESQPHLAMPWLQKAAAAGNTHAQMNLAQLLADEGAFGDALKLVIPIADSGAAVAQNNAGMLYAMMGDVVSARKYWYLAAKQADAMAFYNLGIFYKNQNERVLALEWLKLAARRKHPTAQQVIDNYDNDQDWVLEDSAEVYEKSLAAEAAGNHEEARRLLEVSASAGWVEAQYDLGIALLEQWSTEENADDALRDQAMNWFVLAARSGDQLAIQELKDNLTEEAFKALNL
jgi:TPR repeat protein